MNVATVTERLVAFVREWSRSGPPSHVTHEANRLLLNQLKASVGAVDHPVVRTLYDWARDAGSGPSSVLWLGGSVSAEHAAVVNAALFEVLDFNETYIPCYMHAVSGVLPAVIAEAERLRSTGLATLNALALGIEVELAVASILMPTGYFRGFIPGGITGAIGGAAACALLGGLNDTAMRDAIGLAMNAGCGFYQSAGSMALPFVMGVTARNGLNAYQLAARGISAPAAAFEGDKGMLSSYSDEPSDKIDRVLSEMGRTWRILDQSYKTVPTETITHGPIECGLALLKRSGGRDVARMRFGVAAIVVDIAEERAARFGQPSNELEARFDLRHCAAAAWVRGRFTLAEMRKGAFADPKILDLRERIELVADPAHPTFDGASLEVVYADGSSDQIVVPNFLGTPGNPMSDEDLSNVFRTAAAETLSPAQTEAVLDAAWGLSGSKDINALIDSARILAVNESAA